MTGDRLRALVAAANPGPWEWDDVCISPHGVPVTKADADLVALAPELALLLADTIDALEQMREPCGEPDCTYCRPDFDSLLARFRGAGRIMSQPPNPHKEMPMRNLTAAALLTTLIVIASLTIVTRTDAKIKVSSATYRAECAVAYKAVRYYRDKTAAHRAKLAATELPPVEQNASCSRLRERAVYWRTNARNHAKVVRYHYDWQSWLPANWQQLGACETGYGRRPGNFNHANSRFVSAFGISRSIYDRDAAHMGAPPWNDRRIPTPRQQYLAALGHLDLWGDGWTCPGP